MWLRKLFSMITSNFDFFSWPTWTNFFLKSIILLLDQFMTCFLLSSSYPRLDVTNAESTLCDVGTVSSLRLTYPSSYWLISILCFTYPYINSLTSERLPLVSTVFKFSGYFSSTFCNICAARDTIGNSIFKILSSPDVYDRIPYLWSLVARF